MQPASELRLMIRDARPDVSNETMEVWIFYLCKLTGCHLFSAASPDYDKAEWLRQRHSGIGGSEIATLLGENHWSSPRNVWLSKIGASDDDYTQSEAARWGNLLETAVATEWGVRTGRKWVNIPVSLQDDECPWLLANIDGFTLTDDTQEIVGILEVKTTSEYNKEYWDEGPLPYNYICQAMWYCGITHLGEIELTCLVGGQKLYYHTIPFDVELFEKEKMVAKEFWLENVQKCIEPAATEVDKSLIKTTENDVALVPIVLEDDESERLTDAYCQIRDKMSTYKKVKDALYAQIFLLLGKGTQGMTKTHTFNIQLSGRRAVDYDTLQEAFPEAYKKCVVVNMTKSLNIK